MERKWLVEIGQCGDWYVWKDHLTYEEAQKVRNEAEKQNKYHCNFRIMEHNYPHSIMINSGS